MEETIEDILNESERARSIIRIVDNKFYSPVTEQFITFYLGTIKLENRKDKSCKVRLPSKVKKFILSLETKFQFDRVKILFNKEERDCYYEIRNDIAYLIIFNNEQLEKAEIEVIGVF